MADSFFVDARGQLHRRPAEPFRPPTPVTSEVRSLNLTPTERAAILARAESDPVRQAVVAAEALGGGLGGVTISGTPGLGAVLQASLGAGLEATGWQWLRDGTPISGATLATYMLAPSDLGRSVTARATGISYLGAAVPVPSNVPPPPPPPPPGPELTPGLVTFGDSTVYGVAASTPAKRWANLRAATLGLPLINQGISGTVMQNRVDAGGSPRPDNGRSRYATALMGANLRSRYEILYGLNDLRYTSAPATINLANFITDYTAVIDGLVAAGVPASAITIGSPVWIPDGGYQVGSAGFTGSSRTVHEQFIAALYMLAFQKGCKFAPVYEYMRENGGAALVDPDAIHPNDAGHAAIAVAMGLAAVPVTGVWSGAAAPPPPAPADTTAPTLISAVVPNSARANIVLSYSEALNSASVPAAGAFALSGGRTAIGVGINGSVVTVIGSSAYAQGDAISIGYTPGASPIEDVAGNDASAFTARAVTNNISDTSDADVDAWLARVTTAAGTVTGPQEAAVREFVASAKASGYFTKFRRLNVFAGDDAASLVPLVNTSGGANDTNAGTTYSAAAGRQSNGTQYLNTGYVPTQATGGMSIYLRTTQTSSATQRIPIGCRNSANDQAFRLTANAAANGANLSGGVMAIWGGTAPGPFAATTGGMTAGLWQSSRTSGTSLSLFKNGVLSNNVGTEVTPATPSVPVFLFAQNGGGTAGAFVEANTQIGAYGIDIGMTDAEAASYYTHMQALMTALGRNV